MPDYANGKLYKLQCDDGHFYIGSTCNDLRRRFWEHKADATRGRTSLAYQTISAMGWEHVRIVLIEDFPCENKQQLCQREDFHIQQSRTDPLCMNLRRAILTEDERMDLNTQCRRTWEQNNLSKRATQARERYARKKKAE